MKYVIGAVAGLLWGALIAWVNSRINKKAIEKNSEKALLSANFTRTLVDIAALAAVFLLRKVLPFSFEAAICGTAASLGLLTVYFAFLLSRPEGPGRQNGGSAESDAGESAGTGASSGTDRPEK